MRCFTRWFVGVALLAVTVSQASVTLNITADLLKDASGQPMPVAGRVILVASTQDATIGDPTATSFVSGDDQILYSGNLTTNDLPGVLSLSFQILDLSGSIRTGNPIALFWYPEVSTSATAPGAGARYGRYAPTPGAEKDGSEPWAIPADGSVVEILMLTTDALTVPGGGSLAHSAGVASLSVGGTHDGDDGDNGNGDGDGDGDGGNNGGVTDPDPSNPVPYALRGSQSFGNGYFLSNWFGGFFKDASAPADGFLYTMDFGWAWISPASTPEGTWWWSFSMESWMWGSEGTGRFFYRNSDAVWIYVVSYEDGGAWIQANDEWSFLPLQ